MALFSFRVSPPEGLETSFPDSDNKLVLMFGYEFYVHGTIPEDSLPTVLESVRVAFEDGGEPDDKLIEACEFANFALVSFLLYVASSHRSDAHIAARCLAFASNIHEDIWNQYTSAHPDHLSNLLIACMQIPKYIMILQSMNVPVKRRGSYLGYDPRDKAEYHIEGYDDEEELYQQDVARKAHLEDNIMVFLLLLSQFFLRKHEAINVCILNNRDQSAAQDVSFYHTGVNGESEAQMDKETEAIIYELFSNNLLLDEVIIRVLLYIAYTILSIAAVVFEDATQQCIKIIVGIDAQFPPRSSEHLTTEIAQEFVLADWKPDVESKFTKCLLYIVNENGYPNMSVSEGLAAVKLCIHLLHDSEGYQIIRARSNPADLPVTHHPEVHGHFYTNDIKVVVEVCLRELTNIPATEHNLIRMSYLELLDAVLTHSSWAKAGDKYMQGSIASMVESLSRLDPDDALRDYTADMWHRHQQILE